MNDERRTPEEWLDRLKDAEQEEKRGKLKVFLGMAPGVGKTYFMLDAAQKLLKDGVDVISGCVVTHGRAETEKMLAGLPVLPLKTYDYKGTTLQEFDIDGMLDRKPAVALVDELAHTNAPGSRHEKRFQDVQELIDNGIDVYTTLNIQHLESANDVVAQITRVRVRETVPDSVLELATEIEVVDITPDELIERLKEGKVYVPEQSAAALENFFRKGNLIALRELSLRAAAQHIDAQMQKYRQDLFIKEVWPAGDRLLVCVGPHPMSARLVRATKRMAVSLRGQWYAAFVETEHTAKMSQKDRDRVMRTLRLAESLGGETAILSGNHTSDELVSYAHRKNVSKIVIGKPARPRWREILFGSVVDDLIRKSGHIDVYVITGDKGAPDEDPSRSAANPFILMHYFYAVILVALASVLTTCFSDKLAHENLIMFFMLAVVISALRWGKGPSTFCSILSVAVYDFFFVQPLYSFAVTDTQYVITFTMMLIIGLTLGTLTTTVKHQAEIARKRERQTTNLYEMTRDLASARGRENVANISTTHIAEVFDCRCAVLFADDEGADITPCEDLKSGYELDAKEMGVAKWVFLNKHWAGLGTSTLPGSQALYIPLKGASGIIGVIGILPSTAARTFDPGEMHLLETFVNQMALATERAWLGDRAAVQQIATGQIFKTARTSPET